MLLGLAGAFLPLIPSVPLVWLGATGYGVLDGFHRLNFPAFLVLTFLGLVGTTAEAWASQIGARAGGASGWSAAAGSCLGGVAMLFFSLPLALLTALAGVFGVELLRSSRFLGWQKTDVRNAARGSSGWLAGWALSAVAQFAISLFMVLFFLWVVIF
jgi:uncharacterized protein YqgC (DUF456 family)